MSRSGGDAGGGARSPIAPARFPRAGHLLMPGHLPSAEHRPGAERLPRARRHLLRARRHLLRAAQLLIVLASAAAPLARAGWVDPLDVPAAASALAARGPLNDVAIAGERLVAVGQRGHVLWSDDRGETWSQASVPVSTDLNAVHFATARRGWAVGHGGVVLATEDGGRTWLKQLDRRLLVPLLARVCAERRCDGDGDGDGDGALREQIEILTAQGADASFLDVWFDDEEHGFVVGAFNLVVRTEDGGRSWTPWLDRTENPRGLHLYAIRRVAGDLYAAGEQGLLLKLDVATGRLVALRAARGGSFFGLTGDGATVVAFGLGGRAVRSGNRGASWAELDTGVASALTGAAELPRGGIVVVSQDGRVLVSDDGARSFHPASVEAAIAAPLCAVAPAGSGAVVVVGAAGARVERLR